MDEAEICLHCKRRRCNNCMNTVSSKVHFSKSVRQIDPKTRTTVCEFSTMSDAAEQLKIDPRFIWACCSGATKVVAGYMWEVITDEHD